MSAPALHYRIAEHGKVRALAGDHAEALRHYREALRLAGLQGGTEACLRHYAWCVLESLERTDAHGAVISFCEQVEAHYVRTGSESALARVDRAAHLERHGLALVKQGHAAAARERLEAAVKHAGPGQMPVAERVLSWLRSGLHVDARRISLEQERHAYWTVRPGAVRPDIAVALPSFVATPR